MINYRYAAAFNGVGMNGTCGLGIDEADSNVQSRTALISEASLGIAKVVVRCNKSIHSSDYLIFEKRLVRWSRAGFGIGVSALVLTFGAVSFTSPCHGLRSSPSQELIVSLVDSISAEGKLAYISDDAAESIDLL